ncbi:MAG: penicillin-binding transpeptidase domain-containing protein [Actinomycetota bacterium]|nr:penicillin-binding transpeptidase domain-containing protein [Actinomycetota bacterium]
MNRQLRRLGIGLFVLYLALFVQLNVVQVLRADEYNDNPSNTRAVTRDFTEPRGQILSAEGNVLARSDKASGRFPRQRVYPLGDLFGPITGFFSFDVGTDGVEKTYNDELTGRTTAGSIGDVTDLVLDSTRTLDVALTMPVAVQQAAREALRGLRGSVVALDPRDGSILALYSNPTFDPNPLSSVDLEAAAASRRFFLADPTKPLLARSFRETFFPGSTFKIVTGSAGLTSGEVTPTSPRYPASSGYTPPLTNRPIRNFGGGTCGGDLFQILEVSCNTAFAQMGVDIGADNLVGQAEAFGFNERPPIDLPSATASPIAAPGEFVQNTPVLAQTAIGQNAVSSTPLQMALTTAGIANNGVVMKPHVMSEVRDDEDQVLRRYRPEPWKQALSPQVARTMRDAMVGVVADGTAGRLAVEGVPTAGKTGTAQIGDGRSHAWIVGFAPADNPRVAIAVIVESQSGASEATGGRLAAPIGQQVLRAALAATSGS